MENKYINGLMGFVIGDAMGVPVEFTTRKKLLENPVTKMIGYGTYDVPEGTWSDDTSMLIATIDSINTKCDIDIKDIADNFLSWKNHADYTPYKDVFDIGNTTKNALEYYEEHREIDPVECGLTDMNSNGNGSVMRIIPISLSSSTSSKACLSSSLLWHTTPSIPANLKPV